MDNTYMERAYMQKNAAGEVVVDQNGYIKCMSEGGLKFKLLNKDIDFNCDNICYTIDNRDIFIQLNDNVCRTAILMNESANKIVSNEDTNKTDEIEEVITETAFHWTDNSTKLFLHIYKNYINLVAQRRIKTKKIMWQKIAEQMKSQGYNVSILQVENKYKSLERAYKNMKNHNNKTGRHRLVCPFETELSEILGGKHNIEPLLLSGNIGVIYSNAEKTITSSSTLQVSANKENNEVMNINENRNKTETPYQGKTKEFCSESISTCSTIDAQEISDGITSDDNTSCKKAITSKRCQKMGTTARVLDVFKDNFQKLSNEIRKESENRSAVQQQMLEEQQKMRKSYEEFVEKTYEQSIKANTLREERNNILQELIQISRKSH